MIKSLATQTSRARARATRSDSPAKRVYEMTYWITTLFFAVLEVVTLAAVAVTGKRGKNLYVPAPLLGTLRPGLSANPRGGSQQRSR